MTAHNFIKVTKIFFTKSSVFIGSLILLLVFLYLHTKLTHSSEHIDVNLKKVDPDYVHFENKQLMQIVMLKECYKFKKSNEKVRIFEDILKSPPKSDKNVFFIDTLCRENITLTFRARQACAIESAAKWAPSHQIFVLFASSVGLPPIDSMSPVDKALISYKNIHFRNIKLTKFSANTPAQEWIKRGMIFSSEFYLTHLSDYLRYIALFKYGGMYFDTDFIIKKSLENLPPNFGSAQSNTLINSAAMKFEANGFGHQILEEVIRENTENYKPKEWLHSGPGALTRTMQSICGTNKLEEMQPQNCWSFKLFPPKIFNPIIWQNWEQYFDSNKSTIEKTMGEIEDSIGIHFWNEKSKNQKIKRDDPVNVYKILAKENCPNVFNAFIEYL